MVKINLKNSSKSKILIRAANWVGDAIMTTPVLRAVRKNYSNSHITILAKPWVAPVFYNNPNIDEIMIYQDLGRHKKGIGTLRLAMDLRKHNFDLAVLMQNAFEAALITFIAKIPERLGYNTDARGFLLNRSIKLDKVLKKGHLIDYYRGIIRGCGLKDDGRELDLLPDLKEKEAADNILKENKISLSGPVIGINPGATGGTAKRWFPDKYIEVAKRFSDAFNVKIVIFGGPGDEKLGDYILKQSEGKCVNLAGKTTLREAFALIEKCSLFITNDSGLMHAAAALNINQVAVIGPTDFIATPPSNTNSKILRVPVSCSPCKNSECPKDHSCMHKITADMVFDAGMEMYNLI